jgi:pimeloyl-ACP methyl ester carboxylesterase
MTRASLWVFAVAVVCVVAYLVVCYVVAARLSAPVRRPVERTPADFGLGYHEVEVRSSDGLRLSAWWVEGVDSSRAALLVHGWGADKSSRHVLETAAVYEEAGFDVLMIDPRGHGGSEGDRVTLGYREVRDVQGALSWLEKRGFDPERVVLHGWSMGGVAVIQSAPGAGVAAVVEESAYADLPSLLRERLPEVSELPAFFTPGIFVVGRLFLGIDPWAVRPVEEAGQLSREGVPLMIIHSRDDEVVPFEHAGTLAKAHPGAVFWTLEGYEHVHAYEHPEYRERLLGFLDEAARPPE